MGISAHNHPGTVSDWDTPGKRVSAVSDWDNVDEKTSQALKQLRK
jgi:hypothetical protein